jgi:hypothetical protein
MLTLGLFKNNYGQAGTAYIDSVKEHILLIDSLIVEASINPASEINIIRAAAHFSSLAKGDSCANAELFKDGKTESLYRLSYAGNCDSAFRLQDYYFYNNKIIFIRTVKSLDRTDVSDQYYLNDEIVNPVKGELYIDEGYEILKKIIN